MDKFEHYDVVFSGLKNGKHAFFYEIGSSFFDLFEIEQDFKEADIKAKVTLSKNSAFLEFFVSIEGTVTLDCDISNEEFDYHLSNAINVIVKFGDRYDDSNEDIVIMPKNSCSFNVAKLIYEATLLSVPMKRVSPNIGESYLQSLEKFSPKEGFRGEFKQLKGTLDKHCFKSNGVI